MVAARMWLASATGTQASFSNMRSSRPAFGHISHACLRGSSELTEVVREGCEKSCVYTVPWVHTNRDLAPG